MDRPDISPSRRRTRNFAAAPIPNSIVTAAVRRVDHVPDWVDTAVFILHIVAGIVLLAVSMLSGINDRFLVLLTVSSFLFATLIFNAHFPKRIRRWCMAATDLLAVIALRLVSELSLISDPNTTFVVALAAIACVFAVYVDPLLSKTLSLVSMIVAALVLLPYIVPGLFEEMFRVHLTYTRPLQSFALLAALCFVQTAPLVIVSGYRKIRIRSTTEFLERVQIALASRRSNGL